MLILIGEVLVTHACFERSPTRDRMHAHALAGRAAPLRAERGDKLVLAQVEQHWDLGQVVVKVEVGHDLGAVLGALVDGGAVVRGRRLLLALVEAQVHLRTAGAGTVMLPCPPAARTMMMMIIINARQV